MGRHEIWNGILFFAGSFIGFVIFAEKSLINLMGRFSHIMKYLIGNMFRCHTKLSADVIFYEFLQEYRTLVCDDIVKAYAGSDKDFFDFRYGSQLTEKRNIIRMVSCQILTWFRKKTLSIGTYTFCQLLLTGRLTEISGRASYIMNIALKIRLPGHGFCFF